MLRLRWALPSALYCNDLQASTLKHRLLGLKLLFAACIDHDSVVKVDDFNIKEIRTLKKFWNSPSTQEIPHTFTPGYAQRCPDQRRPFWYYCLKTPSSWLQQNENSWSEHVTFPMLQLRPAVTSEVSSAGMLRPQPGRGNHNGATPVWPLKQEVRM